MDSPSSLKNPAKKRTGESKSFLDSVLHLPWSGPFRKIRGKSGQQESSEEPSVGKDSSTHSAIFDLELSNRGRRDGDPSGSRRNDSSVRSNLQQQNKMRRIRYLSSPSAPFEVDLLRQVEALRVRNSQNDHSLENTDPFLLSANLQRMGYKCCVQRSEMNPAMIKDYQPEQSDTIRWHHSFIVCTGRLDGSHTCHCFVDPNFKDQFLIGKPTETYRFLLEILPNVFIGTPLRLQSLIDFVYLEIAQAYCQQQLTVPPWRSHRVLLSRWFTTTSSSLTSMADNKSDQKVRRGLATIDESNNP